MSDQSTSPERCTETPDIFARPNATDQTRTIDWHSDLEFLKQEHDRSFLLHGTIAGSHRSDRETVTDIGRWCDLQNRFVLDRLDSYECPIEIEVRMWAEVPSPL